MMAMVRRLLRRPAATPAAPILATYVDPLADHPTQCRCTFHR